MDARKKDLLMLVLVMIAAVAISLFLQAIMSPAVAKGMLYVSLPVLILSLVVAYVETSGKKPSLYGKKVSFVLGGLVVLLASFKMNPIFVAICTFALILVLRQKGRDVRNALHDDPRIVNFK